MGACCSSEPSYQNKYRGSSHHGYNQLQGNYPQQQYNQPKQAVQYSPPKYNNWGGGTTGGGNVNTYVSAEERRAMQLSAAEKRVHDNTSRGVANVDIEYENRLKRDELIGKIQYWYGVHNKDVPIGLNMASLEQLKAHFATLQ